MEARALITHEHLKLQVGRVSGGFKEHPMEEVTELSNRFDLHRHTCELQRKKKAC